MPSQLDRAPGTEVNRYDFRRSGDDPIGTIAIPVRDTLAAPMVISLLHSDLSDLPLDRSIIQGGLLSLQRNTAVHRMRGDWLLFIDDDMTWEAADIKRLIATRDEHDLDIVGGLCFRRAAPHQPTLYMRERPTEGAYNFLEDWDQDIVEVDATGMAFCIIHRRVFEGIAANNGEVFGTYEERIAYDAPPSFFRLDGIMGEDLRFCQDAKASGFRVWVDTRIEIGHVSEVVVGYRQFLMELSMRPQPVVDIRKDINDKMGFPTLSREAAREKLDALT